MIEIPFGEDTAALFSSPAVVEFASARRAAGFQPTEYTRMLLAEAVRISKDLGEPTTMGAIIEAAVQEHIAHHPNFGFIQDEAVRRIEFEHDRDTARQAAKPDSEA